MNLIIIIVISVVLVLFIAFRIYIRFKSYEAMEAMKFKSVDTLLQYVKDEVSGMLLEDLSEITLSEYERVKRKQLRLKIKYSLTQARYGVVTAVNEVKSLIKSILLKRITEEDIELLVPTERLYMTDYMIWETLIYAVKRDHERVIDYLNRKYVIFKADRWKWDEKLLYAIYDDYMKNVELSFDDKVNILVQYIYKDYKGYGIIDSLAKLDFDGFELGTSGSKRFEIEGRFDEYHQYTRAVWVQFSAKWLHLSFLKFKTPFALSKVVKQMAEEQGKSSLSITRPTKVMTSRMGSRLAAATSPVAHNFFICVRNFTSGKYDPEWWLHKLDKDDNDMMHNWETLAVLVRYLFEGKVTCGITGDQNAGKSSLLKSFIQYNPRDNLRVLDMTDELALNEVMPDRNIVMMIPSDTVSTDDIQDFFKKTDGGIMIVGEVATASIASNMIQAGRLYAATYFTHHAHTAANMIDALATDLVTSGIISDKSKAVEEVLSVVRVNIHCAFWDSDKYGRQRVVSRITEVIPLPPKELTDPRYELQTNEQLADIKGSFDEFVKRQTQGRFVTRDIIRFNQATATYEPCKDFFSSYIVKGMMQWFTNSKNQEFAKFIKENWNVH